MFPSQLLLSSSPDAIVICTDDGVISEWNLAAENLFGWTRDEAIGATPDQLFVPPEILKQYQRALGEMAESGRERHSGQRRITILTKEGGRRAVDFFFRLATDRGAQYIIGYFRDVTHVHYLETRVARLSLESRLLDQAVLYSSEEESFEDALRGALETLCEVTGWPIGHALMPDDEQKFLESSAVWSMAGSIGQDVAVPNRTEALISPGDGLPVKVWQSGMPEWELLSDESRAEMQLEGLPSGLRSHYCMPVHIRGEVIAVLEFFSFDTDPPHEGLGSLVRRLSRALGHIFERREWHDERQRMAAIVESSFDAIISKTLDGTITSWNGGAERLYGYSAEEAVGNSIRIILPGHLSEEEAEIVEAIHKGERLEQFETRRRRKSGAVVNVSLTVSPIRNSAGRVIGVSTIERDITRRKRAQQKLQEAIIAAEQANCAKSEFMANISHELRTPMNAILGMTELALQEELSDAVRDYLATAKESADTMLVLINDILDFSRLEADRLELDPAPFDVRRMIVQTMRGLSLRAHEKGLELAVRVDPDVPFRLVGDAVRLRQILANLVGNAIKFTETGEVVVEVRALDNDRDGDWKIGESVPMKFSVTDTGPGISREDQSRIFAPFTQVDASSTRRRTGTGLGLSICSKLAQLMDGKVSVESELGKGSCFSFDLKLSVAPAADIIAHPTIDVRDLQGMNVLVVDDNDTTRRIVKEMLESWSMKPVTAANARSAIEKLESEAAGFPLLIVDAVMPRMDGIELLEHIRGSTESVGATILMTSQVDQHLFRNRCEELRLGAFLEKPISQSGLLNAIGEVFGNAAFVSSLPQAPASTAEPLNILIAEDIVANQKVVSAILQKSGHQITVAHNGREAINAFERGRFDVILMDVQMPVFDGIQATRTIRQLEVKRSARRTPIIAMTARAMPGDREECLSAGMDAYVSKPLDSRLLLRTIDQLTGPEPEKRSIDSLTRRSGIWKFRKTDPEFSIPVFSKDDLPRPETAFDRQRLWCPDAALRRTGNDSGLLASMVDFFLEDAPGLLRQLRQNLEDGDALEATRAAHSLKGLCMNFEANEAVEAARRVEEHCRRTQLAEAVPLVDPLDQLVRRLMEQLALWKTEFESTSD